MNTKESAYTKRSADFFLYSIHFLKSQSGGQRWNAICEDSVELFFEKYPKMIENPFTRDQVWQLLFDPPIDKNGEIYKLFALSCEKEVFIDFFFRVVQSLLDPPRSWWL